MPEILCSAAGRANASCDKKIDVKIGSQSTSYGVKGIIYLGGFHFNSRFIDPDGNVWFRDGIVSGRQLIKEIHIDVMTGQSLRTCRGKLPVLIVYCKV